MIKSNRTIPVASVLFISALIELIPNIAHPIYHGIPIEEEAVPEGICLLSYYADADEKKDYALETCTGSMISHQHFLTAAHCEENKRTEIREITCIEKASKTAKKYRIKDSKTHPDFKHAPLWNHTLGTKNDFALLEIETPFDLKPLSLPKNALELQEAVTLLQNHQPDHLICGAFGFARSKTPKGKYIFVSHGGSEAAKALAENHMIINYRQLDPKLYVYIEKGDSGGPVACQDDSGNWVILGVLTAYQGRYNYLETLLGVLGWVSGFL